MSFIKNLGSLLSGLFFLGIALLFALILLDWGISLFNFIFPDFSMFDWIPEVDMDHDEDIYLCSISDDC